ncbi:MAG: tRNA (N(6)-L-threonylcarbamoyladenosine(37)-C(2))-methylthiotransferase MtaB [Clostridiales bacterium]|nr:tRNA (N(6)-L-threonylcarbamoyladenosine(37)-C(2))-methylthiotransferase MtaB [Clostridiales bacterium]
MSKTQNFERSRSRSIQGKKVYYQSLGCKVNRYETDAIRTLFEKRGFLTTDDPGDCDVHVINTCTVTAEADRKSGQMIRRARKLAPKAIIAVMGCRIQIKGESDCADVCVGTFDRASLADQVIERLDMTEYTSSDREKPYTSSLHEYEEFGPIVSREGTRAFVKIQDGCDNYCSYCIIPYARGPSRSRKKKDVLDEMRRLGDAGYQEVVLTGINLGSYGKEWGEGSNLLLRLLEEADQIKSIRRIRIGSVEPNMIDEEFVRVFAKANHFCRHLHISLQSGSDSVLNRMNRKYTTSGFSRAVALLRSSMPDIVLTTDIIAGFPTETEKEHEESLRYCKSIGFSKIHVFPYSARNGTVAAKLKPQVSVEKRKKRKEDFLCLSDELFVRSAGSMIGKTVRVLVEEKKSDGECIGYSGGYFRVRFVSGERAKTGYESLVRIVGYDQGILTGAEF